MKRDLDLIRKILLNVESLPIGNSTHSIKIDGYDQDVIAEHVRLLEESEYIEANIRTSPNGKGNLQVDLYVVTRLLSEGHDFIADIKNDTVWRKVRTTIRENSEGVSLAVAKALAVKEALNIFGL